ncbi:MAG TPA: hypothetical protein PLO51_01345 [Candidatus Micrarchaeota archaeon]|nr:hypothetical protein [Candidatus Micrarchaeota archaeon]
MAPYAHFAKRVALAFFIASLACGAIFAAYSNDVSFHLADTSGNPVEGAIVSGSYQSQIAASCSDGFFSVVTDSGGNARAHLENKVTGGQFCGNISYSLSYIGQRIGGGSLEANESGNASSAALVIAMPLGKFTVFVVDYGGNPLPGAAVYLQQPIVAQRVADAGGKAVFFLPAGVQKSAFAEYQNVSSYGSASSGSLEIQVQNFYSNITVNVTDTLGMPLPNATVVLKPDYTVPSQYATDSKGLVFVPYVHGNSAIITAAYNGMQKLQAVPIISRNATYDFVFQTTLSIEVVSKFTLGGGCYQYFIKASDAHDGDLKSASAVFVTDKSKIAVPLSKNGSMWVGKICPAASGRLSLIAPYKGNTLVYGLDYIYLSSYSPPSPAPQGSAQSSGRASGLGELLSFVPKMDISAIDPSLIYVFSLSVYLAVVAILLIFRNELLFYAKSLVRFLRKEKDTDFESGIAGEGAMKGPGPDGSGMPKARPGDLPAIAARSMRGKALAKRAPKRKTGRKK